MSELYTAPPSPNPDYNYLIKLWKRMGHTVPRATLEDLRIMSEETPDKFREYYKQWVYANDTYGGKSKAQDIATNFDKVRAQYEYNQSRKQKGLDPLEIRSLDWSPGRYDDTGNEALNAWYQENGYVPKGMQVYDFTEFKDEYARKKADRAAQAKNPSKEELMRKRLYFPDGPEATPKKADTGNTLPYNQDTAPAAVPNANTSKPDNPEKPKYAPSEMGFSFTKDFMTPEFWAKEANSASNKIKWGETPANGGAVYVSDAGKDGKKYFIIPTQNGRYALMWLSDNETNLENYKGPVEYYSDPNYAKFAAEQYKKIIDSGKTPANKDSYERMFQWIDRYGAWMKDPLGKPMPGGYVTKGDENSWWGKIVEGDWAGAVNGILGIPKELYLNAFNAADQASLGLPIKYEPGMTNRDYMNKYAERRGIQSVPEKLDQLGVAGVVADFGLEILSDPMNFLPGGLIFDALKARGLASAASVQYAKAFAREKVLGQRYNPVAMSSVPTKLADEAADTTANVTVDTATAPVKEEFFDPGVTNTTEFEGKTPVKVEDIIETNGGKTPEAASGKAPVDSGATSTKPYATSRPPYGPTQVYDVWNNHVNPKTETVTDPSGVEFYWDRNKPRKGQWDMGHIPGQKYADVHTRYMRGEISLQDFLEWYRNPDNYRPELPSTNRSHLYE